MNNVIRTLIASSIVTVVALGAGCVPEALAPGPDGAATDADAPGGEAAPGDEPVGETSAAVTLTGGIATLPERGSDIPTIECPGGSVAVGAFGRFGSVLNQIGLVCANLNVNGSFGTRFKTGAFGTATGTAFSTECPQGQAAIGMFGGAGRFVDRVGMICGAPLFTSILGVSSSAGGSGGSSFFDQCPAQSVVKKMTVQASQFVDSIQPHCAFVQP